jgi:uncharacterized protein YceK
MRAAHVVIALAVTLLLTGCQALTPPSSTPSGGAPSPTPTLSTSPVQERETGLAKPRQVFGGDCAQLFTAEEVGTALGVPVAAQADVDIFDNFGIIDEQNGGLRCAWVADGYAALLDVLVLPADATDYDEPSGCGSYLESGMPACPLEASAGGIRISGLAGRFDVELTVIESATNALLSMFEERATPANSAPVPLAAAGSWAYPVDCEAIVAASDFSAVPGLGASSTGSAGGGGSDAYYPAAVIALWRELGLPHCVIAGESVYLYFDAFGGGRWMEAELSAAPASLLPVEGIDAVYATPLGDGTSRINVFDGPNWLQFTVSFTKNAGAIATRLVTALDATAIE